MRNHLKDAEKMTMIGSVFGWLWMIGTPAGIIWILGAIFGDWSWWWALGIFFGAQFCKAVLRSYNEAAQAEMRKGIEVGQLYLDHANTARRIGV